MRKDMYTFILSEEHLGCLIECVEEISVVLGIKVTEILTLGT